ALELPMIGEPRSLIVYARIIKLEVSAVDGNDSFGAGVALREGSAQSIAGHVLGQGRSLDRECAGARHVTRGPDQPRDGRRNANRFGWIGRESAGAGSD